MGNSERKRDAGEAVAKQELKSAHEEVAKFYAEAEGLASAGNVQASKEKVAEAEELKTKTAEWGERISSVPEVCSICGSSKENDSGAEKTSQFSHDSGKIHQGYVLMRKWHSELQAAQDRGELKFVQEDGDGVERSDDKKGRSKDRSRSRRGRDR